ncbi:MAG: hypothetical protein DMENIID0003_08260 [Wolbachia endosymbiont of Sergentomyia squamirostris]|uniref:Uncharacterized protein n=1 Tax=Wolbachia endosymbiont of Sergentomyia squamirostris TaxID=3113640 RepID=A0AAT9GD45_9RICK
MLAAEIPRMNRGMTVRGGMTVKWGVIPVSATRMTTKSYLDNKKYRHWNCKEFANISYYL